MNKADELKRRLDRRKIWGGNSARLCLVGFESSNRWLKSTREEDDEGKRRVGRYVGRGDALEKRAW